MDKKLTLNGKQYELVNIYNSKTEANKDALEFNHTGRWEAKILPTNLDYGLYVRKKGDR